VSDLLSLSTPSGTKWIMHVVGVRPLQINSLFPVLLSGTFACGWAVHYHYFIVRLAAFQGQLETMEMENGKRSKLDANES